MEWIKDISTASEYLVTTGYAFYFTSVERNFNIFHVESRLLMSLPTM